MGRQRPAERVAGGFGGKNKRTAHGRNLNALLTIAKPEYTRLTASVP